MIALAFAAGLFLGVLIGVFVVALCVAAKRGDQEIEELHEQETQSETMSGRGRWLRSGPPERETALRVRLLLLGRNQDAAERTPKEPSHG
jgi:hypothetical protein